MVTPMHQRLRGRPAHTPGPTFLTYTPDGRKLITVGSNNAIRIYQTGSDGEPKTLDDSQESNSAVAATNTFFLTGSEDGTVCKYSLLTNALEGVLVRSSLPVRDVALSPDGKWAAVASDELVVKLVNTTDMTKVLYLREQTKPAKHVSFDPSGAYIAVSASDGIIYVYSLSTEQPELVKKVDGVIRALETDSETSSRAVWHPDGRAFGAPTATRDVQVISRSDWEKQRVFGNGHTADITAVAWSPNGALLATSGADRTILLWEVQRQKVISKYDYSNVMSLAWHPKDNLLAFANTDGEVFMFPSFVPPSNEPLLSKTLQPAPFIHDPLSETSANIRRRVVNGAEISLDQRSKRQASPDSLDEFLGPRPMDEDDDLDDFVIDDDGAGYTNGAYENKKRKGDELDGRGHRSKRRTGDLFWEPVLHEAFQPGSSPWRGNRRYLCLNLTGCVWTVDQETHHTVTVEFYDREYHRDFHFTDPYLYDKACLNDSGTLFSCPPANDSPAMVFYRPHETWTTRADWRTQLPVGEVITAISLSENFIVVLTSTNYVRIFTLFGTPFRVYRQKASPAVTCAAWRDYVLTMGNGSVGADGTTQLLYTIENVKHDEVCQAEDIVALPPDVQLKSVFFSDNGDPCIYDSTGTLLVLLHWRTPAQARWTPLLDTRALERLADGKKQESYWPVAVAQDKFHCIILKGGDQYPYFPRPLLSEFDFKVPLTSKALPVDSEETLSSAVGTEKLEESFVRTSLVASLHSDLVSATNATHTQRAEMARQETEVDKVLLQLLAAECREGEERGMKALEIVGLMRDRTGRMLEAAQKVASRFGRNVLVEKIDELGRRRLSGEEEE